MIRTFFTKAIPAFAVLFVGVFVASRLGASRPMPEVAPEERHTTMVRTMEARPESQSIKVEAMGTVIPARKLDIIPEVGGLIVEINPNLVPGGFLKAGELIARIDPRDYEAAVVQAQGAVEDARLKLELEQGRQVVAKREWEVLYQTTQSSEASSRLALREPHLKSCRAAVESAKSALEQARHNLERATITAPFDSIVESESVETGRLVTPQNVIASLVGAETYWVRVSVPVSQLPWIALPDTDGRGGARAVITQQTGRDTTLGRDGAIIRLLSDLDPDGRMARLLVAVENPLRLESDEGETMLPLLLGAYVGVEIDGLELENVYVIPRTAIREGDLVWIMDDEDRLSVRRVRIVWRRKNEVLIENEIKAGERIVTSRISTPIPGMLLRENGAEDAAPQT
jgi:RND family efflux transporter MFP subunit